MNFDTVIELIYLTSAVLFVVGLKRLQSPATARGGNAIAALAMFVAIAATLIDTEILSWTGLLVGVSIGGVLGGVAARRVQMTDMPQLVGIFNGFLHLRPASDQVLRIVQKDLPPTISRYTRQLHSRGNHRGNHQYSVTYVRALPTFASSR